MKLRDALRLLSDIHTSGTGGSGYAVNLGAQPSAADLSAYNAAWGVVREHLKEPPPPTLSDQFDRLSNDVPNPDLLNVNNSAELRAAQKAQREYVHPWRRGG